MPYTEQPKTSRKYKPVTCTRCSNEFIPKGPGSKYCPDCTPFKAGPKTYMYRYQKKWGQSLRQETIAAYGGVCQCCGESEITFLALDHINGGGAQDRRTRGGGNVLYSKLRKEGYPPGFQVLCANCNWGKYVHGECPHQSK